MPLTREDKPASGRGQAHHPIREDTSHLVVHLSLLRSDTKEKVGILVDISFLSLLERPGSYVVISYEQLLVLEETRLIVARIGCVLSVYDNGRDGVHDIIRIQGIPAHATPEPVAQFQPIRWAADLSGYGLPL